MKRKPNRRGKAVLSSTELRKILLLYWLILDKVTLNFCRKLWKPNLQAQWFVLSLMQQEEEIISIVLIHPAIHLVGISIKCTIIYRYLLFASILQHNPD